MPKPERSIRMEKISGLGSIIGDLLVIQYSADSNRTKHGRRANEGRLSGTSNCELGPPLSPSTFSLFLLTVPQSKRCRCSPWLATGREVFTHLVSVGEEYRGCLGS